MRTNEAYARFFAYQLLKFRGMEMTARLTVDAAISMLKKDILNTSSNSFSGWGFSHNYEII